MADRNDISAAAASDLSGDNFAIFDRLPRRLRDAINEGVVPWCPLAARQALVDLVVEGIPQGKAVALVVTELRAADKAEVTEFAELHRKRYGFATPHVRARATVQRYGRRRSKLSPARWARLGAGAPS